MTSGLSNPDVTGLGDRHSALPMQAFSVGLSRSSRDDDEPFAGEVSTLTGILFDDCVLDDGESTFAPSHEQVTAKRQTLPPVLKGMRSSPPKPTFTKNVFYVDSGAGQCLSSCSTAFVEYH